MPTTSQYLSLGGIIPVYPDGVKRTFVRLQPNVVIPAGTILSEYAFGIFQPYTTGQIPRSILEFDCKTDSSGRAWYYVAFGTNYKPNFQVSVFTAGTFRCCELHGLDMAAVAILGRLIGAQGREFQDECFAQNILESDQSLDLTSDSGATILASNEILNSNGVLLQMS